MGSGAKQMIINSRERALSSDANRRQRFSDATLMEQLRWRFLANAALYSYPLAAEIFGGLLVRPIPGSSALSADAGALVALTGPVDVGDGNNDDSPLVYATNDAVFTDPAFTIGSNAAGSTRIDMIECRPVMVVSETQNRDIFDPETQLFTAANVTKVTKAGLEFRVRQGTPGAGLASVAPTSGWLPLCVASVPAGSTSTDAVTFYDVRPMMEDLAGAPDGRRSRFTGTINLRAVTSGGNRQRATGSFSGTFAGRRIGGRIVRCSPGAGEFDFMRLGFAQTLGTEQCPDFDGSLELGSMVAVFPWGLPRWQRYGDLPLARIPSGPKGLLVMTNRPAHSDGFETASLAMPTAYGFGTVSCRLVTVLTARHNTGGGSGTFTARWHDDRTFPNVTQPGAVDPPGGVANIDLNPGVDFPANATKLYFAVRRSWSGIAVGSLWYQDFDIDGTQVGVDGFLTTYNDSQDQNQQIVYASAATPQITRDANPLPVVLPNTTVSVKVRSDSAPQGGTAGDTRIYVTGWEAS